MSLEKKTILYLAISFSCFRLWSIPACPHRFEYIQPNKSTIQYLLKGDEFFNLKTTLDGIPIAKDTNNYLCYASIDESGQIYCSNHIAHNIENRTAEEKLFITNYLSNISINKIKGLCKSFRLIGSTNTLHKSIPNKGKPKTLVILANFSDLSFIIPNPQIAFNNLLNQKGYSDNGATGSVFDYFNDNSSGQFQPIFDVIGPITLPNNMDFYGSNNSFGRDINVKQMIIDACNITSTNGIDLSIYDTDKDGYIDNIFVFYAGYNEAEGGSSNSIWSQSSTISNSPLFNGVKIGEFCCTSELKFQSGSNICGIGPFCHEYGHLLGLPDYYDTNNKSHHTVSSWSIMDLGSFLNQNMTPPSLSAWDRYFLNWHTPSIINSNGTYILDTLSSKNTSFLLSPSSNGFPSTNEFFMLENRQKNGWDTFLPGHGMLITHIVYNQNDWNLNTVNNDSLAMGVDIIEADQIGSSSTLTGDTYPGSDNITSFVPILRNGTMMNQSINNIKEVNGKISFMIGNENGMESPLINNQLDFIDINSLSNNSISIDLPNPNMCIQLFDISGQLILNKNTTSKHCVIDHLEHNKIYILKADQFNSRFSIK
jgi:M6 family metalloprotease-like protein